MNSRPFTPNPRKGTRLFLFMCAGMMTAAAIWISTGTLDVVSYAAGEVVPSGLVKKIQHLEGGIVKEIRVREGSIVSKGEPLVILESTRILADQAELAARLIALSIRILRLENEISDTGTFECPPHLLDQAPDVAKEETGLFSIRRQRLKDQLAVQQALISQKKNQITEIKARIQSAKQTKILVDEQIEISKKMLSKAISSRMSHINLLKESTDLGGKIEQSNAVLLKTMAAQREFQARISMIKNLFQEEAHQELNGAEQSKRELTQRLLKIKDRLERTTLRSPVDGIIKTLTVNAIGGVVEPGGTVLEVVPGKDQLVVEARLPAQDIGYVRSGQNAQIRLASKDAGRFNVITGPIIHISPDSITTEEGGSFYKIRIQTEQDFFKNGTLRYRLSPGVEVLCSVQIGKRTVLAYFLEPFLSGMGTALQEQ